MFVSFQCFGFLGDIVWEIQRVARLFYATAVVWGLAHRNGSDFRDSRLRRPTRTPETAAIYIYIYLYLRTASNAALPFKAARKSR